MATTLVSAGTLTKDTAFDPAGPEYGDGFLWDAALNDNKVYRIHPTTGAVTLVGSVAGVTGFDAVTYYDGDIWLLDNEEVHIMDASTGSSALAYDLGSTTPAFFVSGLHHDGTNIWINDWNDNTIYLVNPSTGAVNDSFTLAALDGGSVDAMATVGGNTWLYPGNDVFIVDSTTFSLVETIDDPVATGGGTNGYGMGYDGSTFYWGKQTDPNDYFLFTIAQPTLYVSNTGFRFPYPRWT